MRVKKSDSFIYVVCFLQITSMQTPVLVLDNGGSTIKVGMASDDSPSM